jgi:hypothetical protein
LDKLLNSAWLVTGWGEGGYELKICGHRN